MRIVARYSFNQGEKEVTGRYPTLLAEIESVIGAIDTGSHLTKQSKEKTKKFKMLYNPKTLNKTFKAEFGKRGWKARKEMCDYSTEYYVSDYKPARLKGQRPTVKWILSKTSWVSRYSLGNTPSWFTTFAPK